MKMVLGLLCVGLVTLASVPVGADTATVKANRVNVRARADRKAELVQKADGKMLQLNRGDIVEVLGEQPGWKKIQVPAAAIVWVKKEFVAEGKITTDDVNVRSGSSQNYGILGKLQKGAAIEVVKESGDWIAIKPTTGIAGWVSSELLIVTPPAVVSAPATPIVPVIETPVAPIATKPAPPIVTREGTLRPHNSPFPRPGTHELWDLRPIKPVLLCYLDSKQINLASYEGKRVQLTGEERSQQGWDQALVDVTTIKVLD